MGKEQGRDAAGIRFQAKKERPVWPSRWTPGPVPEPLHHHREFELGLCLRGKGHFRIGDNVHPVTAGDIFTQSPFRGHIAWGDPADPAEYDFFYIKPEFLLGDPAFDPLVSRVFHARLPSRIPGDTPAAAAMGACLRQVREIFSSRQLHRYRPYAPEALAPHLLVKARLLEAIYHAHGHHQARGHLRGLEAPARGPSRLLPVLERLHADPGAAGPGHAGMAALAREVGLSPSRLRHLFKQELGQSPGTYAAQVRVRRAVDIWGREDLDLEAMAARVGLDSGRALSRQFRRVMGMGPREYLRGATRKGSAG